MANAAINGMGRRLGVRKATMTTIHAYTSSQAIVDGPSKKWRRGRAGTITSGAMPIRW